jgi:hypothetical protein
LKVFDVYKCRKDGKLPEYNFESMKLVCDSVAIGIYTTSYSLEHVLYSSC